MPKIKEEVAFDLFQIIENAYANDDRRFYHNDSHLNDCFNELFTCEHLIPEQDKEIFGWALSFHDFAFRDEAESAAQARKFLCLTGAYTAEDLAHIERLILLTDHKEETWDKLWNEDYMAKLIVDIDLSILGKPWETYIRYARNIWQEYKKDYDWNDFKTGRIMFLNTMLNRDSIYKSLFFKEKYEESARINIKKELEILLESSY